MVGVDIYTYQLLLQRASLSRHVPLSPASPWVPSLPDRQTSKVVFKIKQRFGLANTLENEAEGGRQLST